MSSTLLTPTFRAAYVALFRPTPPKDNPEGPKKFAIRAVFPPNADLKALRTAASKAAADKWGDKVPKTMRSPFRKNSELDSPIPGIEDDAIIMTFSANENRRPGLVGPDLQEIIDESRVYSGAYFRAEVRAYAYEASGNRGVGFGLNNVQLLRDGDPIGSGRMPASKVFSPVETTDDADLDAMFS